jgi:peptidyl-prolyl cis-trans isomerase B (cyclophilin B)
VVSQEQRRRQLAREKFLRQQQRRTAARRKARMRNAVIASVLGVVLVGSLALYTTGTLRDDEDTVAKSAEASPSAAPSKAPDPCEKPADGAIEKLQFPEEPPMKIVKSEKYTMTLDTTCGKMSVALDAEGAPHTVNSFAFLAGKHYFDHTKCHRLTSGGVNVLQCGDPTAAGNGGPGYQMKDENLKSDMIKGGVYPAGTVAMANAGPNTNGSQFFLVYADSQLPPQYTPFGKLDEKGMAVLKKIAAAGESSGMGDGAPNATVVIDKATVTKS